MSQSAQVHRIGPKHALHVRVPEGWVPVDHEPFTRRVASHRTTKYASLAVSPRRPRSDSARAPGQLPHSASGHHGRGNDCLVRAPAAVVALLRFDGDRGFGDWRLCLVPARSQRREGSTRTQVLAPESRQSLQDLRALGLRRNWHPGCATPACTYGSISICGGRYAISGKEIPGGAYAWPNLKIHDSGLLGRALWAANNRVHCITRTPRRSHDHRGADCHSGCGFLLSGWKKGKTWTQGLRRLSTGVPHREPTAIHNAKPHKSASARRFLEILPYKSLSNHSLRDKHSHYFWTKTPGRLHSVSWSSRTLISTASRVCMGFFKNSLKSRFLLAFNSSRFPSRSFTVLVIWVIVPNQ